MRSCLRLFVLVLIVPAIWTSTCVAQAFDKAVLDRVKDATVFIKVSIPKLGEGSGSGFVMSRQGDTVLIMTNRHVVAPEEADMNAGGRPQIRVVFRSGTPQQQELPATLLDYDDREVRDLALLEVRGVRDVPQPIPADVTSSEPDFFETMQVYALGFPRGRQIGAIVGNMNDNPAITVTSMSISSFRRDQANRLGRVQLNGSVIEGNSGGPLVDAKGRLVGVIVARLRGEAVGFAIPPSVIAQFLAGDIGPMNAELVSLNGGTATVKVAVKLIDPHRKIQSLTVHAGPLVGAFIPSTPNANGSWPLIGNAVHSPMSLANKVATGQFSMAMNSPTSRKLLVQFTLTGTGMDMNTKAIPIDIPIKPGTIGGLSSKSQPSKAPQWSCEVNVTEGVAIKSHPGGATIELPAGKAMVCAPQYSLFNAPAAMVQVDGDFFAVVAVTNEFDPGGTAITAPKTNKKFPFTFQGAGFLIWQDTKNFIRLERTKGSASSTGVGLIHRVLLEVYKEGKVVGLHYSNALPDGPIILAARRKGTSIQLLYGESPQRFVVFRELAVDFKPTVMVGLSASNLSKQPLTAKFDEFSLRKPDGAEIAVRPVVMTSLVGGIRPQAAVIPAKPVSGTQVLEGASLKVIKTVGGTAEPQDNMTQFRGKWSEDRQLRWQGAAKGDTLSIELPVEVAGKYDLSAIFTMAPDHGRVRLSLDSKPLFNNKYIDYYFDETRPAKAIALGSLSLEKGSHTFTITIQDKNPKSAGFGVGIDEIQLVPAKK